MVVIRLMGGLGNQMFQYALGLNLSLKYKTPLILDKFYLDNRKNISSNSVIRNYDLDIFNLHDDVQVCNGDASTFKRNFSKFLPYRYRSYYVEPHFHFDPNVFDLKRENVTIEGYWQSYNYFIQIEDLVRKKFQFKNHIIAPSLHLYKEILETNSVCLNVRRADFLNDTILGYMDIDYFRSSIKKMEHEFKFNCKYFIFSDDINWCNNNFHFLENKEIVDHSHKGFKFSNYLQLMMSCKHFIIPNSSFAWWAAYLSTNPSKVVIAPKKWFNDSRLDTSDLIPANWCRI